MRLSEEDREFVEKRARLTRLWPWVGGGVLLILAMLGAWLWVTAPYLLDPWAVAAALEAGALPHSTSVLMAAMLPVVMLLLLASVAVGVLLAFAAFSNERRLIRLIQRSDGRPDRGSRTEQGRGRGSSR